MRGKSLLAGIVFSVGLSLSFNPALVSAQELSTTSVAVEQTVEQKSWLEKIVQIEPKIEEYLPLIEEHVKKYENIYHVDPLLVIALLKAETYNFDKNAISWAGAAGMAQIIGETAELTGIEAYNPSYIPMAREDRRTSYRYRNKALAELGRTAGDEVYIVKKGDTLGEIAKEKGKKFQEILDANPKYKINPHDIDPGDEVIIPGDETESAKKFLEYKRQYQYFKNKANDAFKKYAAELREMTEGKTEEELREIDARFIPEVAIDFCVKHLAELLRSREGDVREAVSAYNAGLGAVRKYGGIPPYDQTVKYQNRIINYFRNYKDFMEDRIDKPMYFINLEEFKGNRDIEQRL